MRHATTRGGEQAGDESRLRASGGRRR